MFRDFEKAPSKSSYQLKFLLAGLAALALLFSLWSSSRVKSQLAARNQTTTELTDELESRNAQLEIANSQLEETIAQLEATEKKFGEADSEIMALTSSQSSANEELDAASARVVELTAEITAREEVLDAVGSVSYTHLTLPTILLV